MMISVSPRRNAWLTDSDICVQHDDEHAYGDNNNDHNGGDAIDNEGEDDLCIADNDGCM